MKQIILYFDENLSAGFSKPRRKRIAMYIDVPAQSLRLDDLNSEKRSFHCRRHPAFAEIDRLLNAWVRDGITATVCKHFESLKAYDEWRKTVGFRDDEVHWQMFIEHDNGTWDLFLELSLAFPRELEQLYRLAQKKR